MTDVRLMTLDPGHFHAALVQKEIVPGISPQSHVYAPLGPDLLAHLGRLAVFNARPHQPTAWEVEVHAGPDPLGRLLRERPGNVLVLSGRNRTKINAIAAAVEADVNVLADKPWILTAADLPKLEAALDTADRKGVVAYDIMTERHEITSILQRELVNAPELFGQLVPGTPRQPAIWMESVHYLVKKVAGVPLRRPAWFFDVEQQGEGLTDVGTHLVDLVPWVAFPDRPLDYRRDVEVLAGERWPSVLTRADFEKATGEADFPSILAAQVRDGSLEFFCNNRVAYTVGGVHVRLDVLWKVRPAAGAGDTHFARFRGTRSRVEVRQGKEQGYRPELYVVANRPADREALRSALVRHVEGLQSRFPGAAVEEGGEELRLAIPERYRVGHEAHFAEVTRQFLGYLRNPASLPAWEKANMLAKYHVTTRGVELARRHGHPAAPRA